MAIAAARQAGFQGFPVLCRIHDGVLHGEEPARMEMCNHAITAIQVPPPVDLPSIVEVNGARYLLYDPTSRTTPIGRLPEAHRNAKVLICFPTGGQWVEVPAKAIPDARVNVTLTADVDKTGHLVGVLSVQEWNDALGLASTHLERGPSTITELLASLFSINATSDFRILKTTSSSLPQASIFEIQLAVDADNARRISGEFDRLSLPGLPPGPHPIQPLDQPRRTTIKAGRDLQWLWKGSIKFPSEMKLQHPEWSASTAFREIHWKGQTVQNRLDLTLDMKQSQGIWEGDQIPEGLRKIDSDRHTWELFLGTCLKIKPEVHE